MWLIWCSDVVERHRFNVLFNLLLFLVCTHQPDNKRMHNYQVYFTYLKKQGLEYRFALVITNSELLTGRKLDCRNF